MENKVQESAPDQQLSNDALEAVVGGDDAEPPIIVQGQRLKKLVLAKETLQGLELSQLDEACGGGLGDTGTACPSRGMDTVQACC